MDRLTIRNSDGAWDVPLRVDDDGAYIPSQEIIDRLARYEDTGLEPEEIKRSDSLLRGFIDLSRRHARTLSWIEKVMIADREGRLLVLPCKVGDMAYFRRGRDIIGDIVERIVLDGMNQVFVGAHKVFIFRDFGKTVFLTREEAEKALEGMKNDVR